MAEPKLKDRRRHGRFRSEKVSCDLGEVVNLSASGLCVQGSGPSPAPIGQTVSLCLSHPDGHYLRVRALVTNVTTLGNGKYNAGMEFVGVTPEIQAEVLMLIRLAAPSTSPIDAR